MKMVFLPEGEPECVRWVRVEERDKAAARLLSEAAASVVTAGSAGLLVPESGAFHHSAAAQPTRP
jgi:hypothetical protein